MNGDFQLPPELAGLIGAGGIRGRSGSVRRISSMSTMNNLEALQKLCEQFQPRRTLEVGLAFGGSAILFTAFHRRTGAPAGGQHTAVDPFQTEVWDEVGLVAIEDAGLRGYLDFRPILSSLALPQLVAEKTQFDLIYIDGSHLFEDVFIDFYYATRLLCDGGIIAFDDSSDPHVRKVLGFIKANFGFALDPIDLGPYRADRGASLRYRVASALGRVQLTAFRKIGPSVREWNSKFTKF